ncbi:MAG: glycoside hydrolase, partial [Chitinophagaceae bacterium]
AAVDGGFVENILVDGVKSLNTGNVLYLRIGDRWSKGKKSNMKNIEIKNVYAEVPVGKPDKGYLYEGPIEDLPRNISPASIVGLPGNPIENVKLTNITIVYPGGGNPHYAFVGLSDSALNSIPEMEAAYPEFSQFKELPAWGFYIRHAKNITFENLRLTAAQKDYRPAIVLDKVNTVQFKNFSVSEPANKKQIFPYKVTGLKIIK